MRSTSQTYTYTVIIIIKRKKKKVSGSTGGGGRKIVLLCWRVGRVGPKCFSAGILPVACDPSRETGPVAIVGGSTRSGVVAVPGRGWRPGTYACGKKTGSRAGGYERVPVNLCADTVGVDAVVGPNRFAEAAPGLRVPMRIFRSPAKDPLPLLLFSAPWDALRAYIHPLHTKNSHVVLLL